MKTDDTLDEAKELIEKSEKRRQKNQKKSPYLVRIDYLVEKYRTALFFVFFQIIVILILTAEIVSVKDRVVMSVNLPKTIHEGDYGQVEVGMNDSNDLFYKVWGKYLIESTAQAKPEEVQENFNELHSMMHRSVATSFKPVLDKYAAYNVKNKITTEFKAEPFKVDRNPDEYDDDDIVVVRTGGVQTRKIGRLKKERYSCDYSIAFKTFNYQLFVMGYKRKCEPLDLGGDTAGEGMRSGS
ncbi:TraE/TraK family type IV conjugative transfer system protein [Thiomicrolovo sp. ZZH C-3]